MPKIALAKKITRNQALSYDRTVPNGLGVTAISAVNGRGSYSRFAKNRYKKTRALLRNATFPTLLKNGDDMFYYKSKRRAKPNKGMSRKQKEKCAPLVSEALKQANEALDKIGEKAKPRPRKGGKRKLTPKQRAALAKGRKVMAERRDAAASGGAKKPAKSKPAKKKAAPKKAAPKKASPKKASPKKSAPSKAATKKVARKGTVAKKAPKKAGAKRPKASAKKPKFKKVSAIYVKANRKGRKGKYRKNQEVVTRGGFSAPVYSSLESRPVVLSKDEASVKVSGLAAYRERQRAFGLAKKQIEAESAALKASKKAAQDALKAVRAANKGRKDKAARAAILAAEAAVDAESAKLKAAESVADAKIKAEKAKLKAQKPAKAKKKAAKRVSPPTRYKGKTVYGGVFKSEKVRVGSKGVSAPVVKVGNKSFPTYMYVDKKGRGRKLPSWMLAGAPSQKAYREQAKYREKLDKKRKSLADSVTKRILKGTYPFTPNKSKRVFSFQEWEKTMKKHSKKHSKKRARRNPLTQAAANKMHRNGLMQAAANKRGRKRGKKGKKGSKRARRNPQLATYISNPGVAVDTIVSVLKDSALVGGGLLTHKALTNLVASKVEFFSKNKYGKSIAAAAVAAVGIPAAALLGKPGEKLGIGMGAALIHTVLVNVLSAADKPDAAAYLGDYTEADMRLPAGGYGSYYEFSPGQTYAGMGEYIQQTGPLAGFGEPMLAQAAAGFGSPMLAQAAAGVGEYIVTGAEGIGEYEQVTPEYTQPSVTREGISPDLGAAEQALSIAEAAAGVGGMGNVDLSLEQIVYPQGQALDIGDQPGGSRAGVFYGGNGVFGP